MNPRTAPLLFALLLCMFAQAQDTLFYTTGKFVTGRVEEVGVELVRYRTSSGDGSVLVVAEKRDLARIKLQGGQEFILLNGSTDVPATEAFLARKQTVTMDVLAPALNHIVVGYERAIGRRMTLCGKLGYIGFWKFKDYYSNEINSKGGMVTLGVKFILPPGRRKLLSAREQHPLSGWYLRPDVLFSKWERQYSYIDYGYYPPYVYGTGSTPYTSCALNLTIGRQVLLGERFTFDIHGGLGYGLQWKRGELTGAGQGYSDRQYYAFSHAFLGEISPLTVSGGMSFGYVF